MMELPVSHTILRPFWSFSIHAILLCMSLVQGSESATTTTFRSNETDRLALLAFKDRITDDPNQVTNSWNSSFHFCEWQGVTCGHKHRRVTTLDLESLSLVGSISPYIGNLSILRGINLRNNSFHGEIPQEISHLFRLQHLNLAENSFSGEIPTNLTHCSDLRTLDLFNNEFTGKVPVELGSLLKLVTLVLSINNLRGTIPSSLGNLSSLEMLSLTRNNLDGNIPDSLGQLARLTFLGIGANKLSGTIPSSLYNLSSINIFSLVENQLSGGLPPNVGLRLPHLQVFAVGVNQFTGPIPVTLSNASELEILSFSRNNLAGPAPNNLGGLKGLNWVDISHNWLGSGEANDLSFLTTLINCSNLENLDLHNNRFGGVLPNSIANLSDKLITLKIGGNRIVGGIPVGIENFPHLTLLDIGGNFFTSSIPVTIGKLQSLQRLFLNINGFSGPIPSSLGNLSQLYELHLEENSLGGSIPTSLGNCQHLQILNLSQNNISDTIPQEVIGLPSLTSLNLAHNSLIGSLPLEVGKLKNLHELDVSENKLYGEIPITLGNCLSLEHLYMQGNFLQGTIPLSLSNLRGIEGLDLSRNNLSGTIPKDMEDLPYLLKLNLSFNNLEGEVPIDGVFKNVSAVSIAGNSKFCGGIPELQLPACPIQQSEKRGRYLLFKVIIPTASVILSLTLVISFLTLYWRRKPRRKPSSTISLGDWYLRVSYDELFKATDGFASANLIGVGSSGSVYKGIFHQYKTTVAVKVLNLQEQGASKSFIAECEALRKVRHRNLLKILSSCSSVDFRGNNFKALVFEFMPNGSLESWLHPSIDGQHLSRTLNLSQRLNIAIDVASALDYLHHCCQTPIVHCDLKPSNVLLDNDMTAHVCDFGLAKFLCRSTSISSNIDTSSVAIKGSIGYIAPEYGMGGEVSTQGDVYSYGILLLEMFTGKRPTDDMFKDGLSLYNFSKTALPDRVMEIMDPCLLSEEQDEATNYIEYCLVSIVRLGVACSVESSGERMDIKDVVKALHAIKDKIFLCWD